MTGDRAHRRAEGYVGQATRTLVGAACVRVRAVDRHLSYREQRHPRVQLAEGRGFRAGREGNPMATARWCCGTSPGSARESATSSACRCGVGRPGRASSRHSSSRSPRAANESAVSPSTRRATRTVKDDVFAVSIPACHSVVFPIPASPSSKGAAGSPSLWRRKVEDALQLDLSSNNLDRVGRHVRRGMARAPQIRAIRGRRSL